MGLGFRVQGSGFRVSSILHNFRHVYIYIYIEREIFCIIYIYRYSCIYPTDTPTSSYPKPSTLMRLGAPLNPKPFGGFRV